VVRVIVFAVGLLMAGGAAAQERTGAPSPLAGRMEARYQVAVMEAVLEQAVQHGAQLLGRRVQAVTPNLLLFSGAPRARGFRLDGYGVFFDVEVPTVRRSVMWSFHTLSQPDPGIRHALQSLRQHVQTVSDSRARTSLEQALKRVELQFAPQVEEGDSATPAAAIPRVPAPVAFDDDPTETYAAEVQRALVDAMLDHSGAIALGSEEWLAVGARYNDARLAPVDLHDTVTVILRIRGADLAAFRADRLTRDEARKRVEVQEF
jgi:hypothetical protein